MALENSNDMVMPVSPMNGGYGNGTFGNDGWWIILLFILLGRGGYGYGGSGIGAEVQSGFNQAALQNGLTDIQQSICNGFAGAEASASARQMAAMNQAFAAQTAAILANNEAQTAALENYLNPPARPAYIVQNPNCCQGQWSGCSCGIA